ncbi:collagen alpha 3VI chain [Echinococcus multilocularis]|uniref:Collagen alpha 3VI chain n=1 Tax=Echinococcus multilocularis TaxID=6211 RepID=A0A0S4MQ29_ECHMU|nr:collagen alpha 3VI chain [Echinococcus multilocularis]
MIKNALLALLLLYVTSSSQDGESMCSLPIEGGQCRGYVKSYAYDSAEDRCVRFIYTGCGGNPNRFEHKIECLLACVKHYKQQQKKKKKH